MHFFINFCEKVNIEKVDLQPITFLKINKYISQYKLVKFYRNKNFKIYPILFPLLSEFIFFGFKLIFNFKVFIHVKKVNPKILFFLKKIFNNLYIIIDLEGDLILEKKFFIKKPIQDQFL